MYNLIHYVTYPLKTLKTNILKHKPGKEVGKFLRFSLWVLSILCCINIKGIHNFKASLITGPFSPFLSRNNCIWFNKFIVQICLHFRMHLIRIRFQGWKPVSNCHYFICFSKFSKYSCSAFSEGFFKKKFIFLSQ